MCGPSFDGSAYVRGADADLIVDGCLYDVKTTMKQREGLPRNLRQLLGYELLDWHGALGLERAGFYFSRLGAWLSWELEELVRQTAAPGATRRQLRDDFHSRADEYNPRPAAAAG